MSVETYEQVPYESRPYRYATAERLALHAHLFGLDACPPSRARVLEIGCAGGGNLIPRALDLPEARFLGIDPAENHVRQAQQTLYALGLDNIEVERRGVEELSDDDGVFDYVIAHGVYSWIPDELRPVLVQACKDRLAPNGVAYISYNTLPGWRMRSVVRDAMLFHATQFEQPDERIAQARAMLEFLAEATPVAGSTYQQMLQTEASQLRRHGDDYLFHDHLSPHNTPVYVADFLAEAREHGLDFLAEAILPAMLTLHLPESTQQALARIAGDMHQAQQYLDFLTNRAFRNTLLVHEGREIDRTLRWQRCRTLHVASALSRRQGAGVPLEPGVAVSFTDPGGRELTTEEPAMKAGWSVLSERFPEPMPFPEWVAAVEERLPGPAPADLEESLARNLLYAYARSLAELWVEPLVLDGHEAERPRANGLARLQALSGAEWVTTRRHEGFTLDPLSRRLIVWADGSRDHAGILEGLLQDLREDALRLTDPAHASASDAELRELLAGVVADRLEPLGRSGVLVPAASPRAGEPAL